MTSGRYKSQTYCTNYVQRVKLVTLVLNRGVSLLTAIARYISRNLHTCTYAMYIVYMIHMHSVQCVHVPGSFSQGRAWDETAAGLGT